MTSLADDIARCVGRFGLGPDDPVCPRRSTCLRYVTMEHDRIRWAEGYPKTTPVSTGLCRDGGDYFIPLEEV